MKTIQGEIEFRSRLSAGNAIMEAKSGMSRTQASSKWIRKGSLDAQDE